MRHLNFKKLKHLPQARMDFNWGQLTIELPYDAQKRALRAQGSKGKEQNLQGLQGLPLPLVLRLNSQGFSAPPQHTAQDMQIRLCWD